jgi:hypothetical protein
MSWNTAFGVEQWAYGERDLLVDDVQHQALVFDGPHTVVDTLYFQDVERLPDVLERAFFVGVGYYGEEAFVTGTIEYALELAWRVTHFRTIQAQGHKRIAERQRLVEGFLAFALIMQEAAAGADHATWGSDFPINQL